MKRITIQTLRGMNACERQVKLFEKFLDGRKHILPTQKTIEEASQFGLDILWAIRNNLIENYTGSFVDKNGWKHWYVNDKHHREDGPAIEFANGDKRWYLNDKLHREDGPAVECANGTKSWYVNGLLHREDGPAVECANGTKSWYVNGLYHREDGPAVEYASGTKEWYLNGKFIRSKDKQ